MDTVAPSLTLPVDDTASQARRARDARRGLAVFFALLIPFSLFFEALMIISGNRGLWVVPLMLTPALTSVVTRLITRQGFADVSFRPGGRRGFQGILFALFFPIVICVVSYGIAWTMGLAPFTVSLQNPLTRMLAGLALSPVLNFLLQLLLMCTVGTLINSFVTAGEEIGWRGFMLTRLIDAGAPYPVLLSGFIWALWHVPVILGGVYAAGAIPAVSTLIFVVMVTAFGVIFARLRLATGSIWPVIILHACWNAVIQNVFNGFTTGTYAWLWTDESGILVAGVMVLAAILVARGPWTIIRNSPRRGA